MSNKIKKSDLRYGDVIRLKTAAVKFSAGTNALGEDRPEFHAREFKVDVLPPPRGKKTPVIELRPTDPAYARYTWAAKGKWPEWEVASRLPDDVQVFKTRATNHGGMIHFTSLVLARDGRTWNDKAIAARDAMQAARELGCAVIVFRAFGYAEVWPFPDGVPSLEFLQQHTEDPYNTIAPAGTRLGGWDGPYLAYAGDNALSAEPVILNETAQFALLNDPELREMKEHLVDASGVTPNPDFHECRYAGNVVLLVGFSICPVTGNTIRTPVTLAQAAD